MQKKDICFIVPIYPPHFHYARDLLASLDCLGLNQQADLWFVFTNEEEKSAFGDYDYSIVLPEELRIFDNNGIINIKKLYAVSLLKERYEYIIVIDAETQFIKNVDLISLCERYFTNKILLGNRIIKIRKEITTHIQNSCKRFFVSASNKHFLDTDLYLWFNQPCIYKSSTIDDFFSKLEGFCFEELTYFDFDYYIMYYLVLFQNFSIEYIGIDSDFGVIECGYLEFTSDRYKQFLIMICTKRNMEVFDNPNLFMIIHLNLTIECSIHILQRLLDICHSFAENGLNKHDAVLNQYNALLGQITEKIRCLENTETRLNTIFNSKIYRISKKIYSFIRFIYRVFKKIR